MTEKRQGRDQHQVSVLTGVRLIEVSVKRELTVYTLRLHNDCHISRNLMQQYLANKKLRCQSSQNLKLNGVHETVK